MAGKIPLADQPIIRGGEGPPLRGPCGITKSDIDGFAISTKSVYIEAREAEILRDFKRQWSPAPAVQPPIIREPFVATRVEFHTGRDYASDRNLGVSMQLDKEHPHAPGTVTERGVHMASLTLHLPAEYAGQFCAGQRFWLTINPAGKDE